MSQITTTIENQYVKFAWSYPTDNSDTVTQYDIQIKGADGSYTSQTTYCSGSWEAIIANMYCHIPMQVLRAAPFNLQFLDFVYAKVRARNSIGWGSYSTDNAGTVQIQVEPVQMSVPSRGSLTTSTQIEVTWTALSSNSDIGGAQIQSYNLQYDSDGSNTAFVDLVGAQSLYTTTSYTVLGLIPGVVYNFRVRAQNKWGYGPFSNIHPIQAS